MSSDAKNTEEKRDETPRSSGPRGVRIFTYPKIVFILPTLFAALVCGFGMLIIGNNTHDPREDAAVAAAASKTDSGTAVGAEASARPVRRFGSPQNFLAVTFLFVFLLNMLVMAIDFPRFTVLLILFLVAAIGFFLLWLNVHLSLLPPLVHLLDSMFLVANASFYFALATILLLILGVVWATRYLDYWEVLPNELLHNHGPFSDLERFPTMQLKFDKEIPDILEYAFLRSGTLIFHIPGVSRAVVLENVLWINTKEEELKRLLSRMEVRISNDQPTGDSNT